MEMPSAVHQQHETPVHYWLNSVYTYTYIHYINIRMIDVSNTWNITPMIVAPGKFAMLRGEGRKILRTTVYRCIFFDIYIYIRTYMIAFC